MDDELGESTTTSNKLKNIAYRFEEREKTLGGRRPRNFGVFGFKGQLKKWRAIKLGGTKLGARATETEVAMDKT